MPAHSPDVRHAGHTAPRAQPSAGRSAARRIRVLQLAYGTALYGAERWVLALINHLDPARVETVVGSIQDRDSQPFLDEARRLGFRTATFGDWRRGWMSAIRPLREAIRAQGIDVVHSHGTRQDLVSLLSTATLGCSTLSTPHGWEWKGSPWVRLSDSLNRGLFSFFDAVAPVSGGLTGWLLPGARARIRSIPNGVDVGEVERAVPPPGLLPGQASPTDFVIGYMGQLIPRKGVDVLLQSLPRLGASGWCCLVLGDGPSRAALERQARALGIEAQTRFLAFRPDRLGFLKRFDVMVLPSYREGTPRALMEALVAGVPCIGTRIPGIGELLVDGVTGLTVPPGDPARLAAAIACIRSDRVAAARMAADGRAAVYARRSADAMARAYESLYAELVDAR